MELTTKYTHTFGILKIWTNKNLYNLPQNLIEIILIGFKFLTTNLIKNSALLFGVIFILQTMSKFQ